MDDLQALKEEEKVRFIGISNPDMRADTALPLVQSGLIDSVQTVINIFDPTPFDCLVPLAMENDVAIIARCVMDEGGLSGFLTEETVFEEHDFRKTFFARVPRSVYIERVNHLKQYIPKYASSLAGLAIKFATQHPGVTTAITSMHVSKYANENIEVMNEDVLPARVFEEIRKFHRWVRNFYDDKFWDKEAVGGSIGK